MMLQSTDQPTRSLTCFLVLLGDAGHSVYYCFAPGETPNMKFSVHSGHCTSISHLSGLKKLNYLK